MRRSTSTLLALSALFAALVACGGAVPPGKSSPVATEVVLCPSGSTFHAGENRCVASSPLAAAPPPAPPPSASAAPPEMPPVLVETDGRVDVRCRFSKGWVAVVPKSVYPADDAFLMQSLIGLAEEPEFWQKLPEYAPLEPYKAHPCTSAGVSIGAPAGDVFVLVGEADTFTSRQKYARNGLKKKVTLKKGEPLVLDVDRKDLVHSFSCISCPWVHFEGSAEASTPPFVMLARRASRGERGRDTRTLRVPVVNGKVRVVLEEHEHEVTHLDALDVSANGTRLRPVLPKDAPLGARFALEADDGLEVLVERGARIVVEYQAPEETARDTTLEITVGATGYYLPLP